VSVEPSKSRFRCSRSLLATVTAPPQLSVTCSLFIFLEMSTIRVQDVKALLRTSVTFDKLKTVLFVYVLLKYFLRAERHLFARGITQTVREIVQWITQRVILLALRLPAARHKVDAEMGKAKIDIEAKLVPKGAGVTRHLSLPHKGQSNEWIVDEMQKMDGELEGSADYRNGKLSGAVYRKQISLRRVSLRQH
jgi:sphinganine-1-phosphate aldolase